MLETDYELRLLAKHISADRVRDAEKGRLFLSARKTQRLPLVLRSLLAIFV